MNFASSSHDSNLKQHILFNTLSCLRGACPYYRYCYHHHCHYDDQNTVGNWNLVKASLNHPGYLIADIKECETEEHNCDADANCVNTIGSFMCTSKLGFIGIENIGPS